MTEFAAASFVSFRGYIQPVLSSFIEYDNQIRTVAAVTGASAAQMAELSKRARELGATTSFSAAQVAEGMTALGRMGFTTREIETAIAAVMDLSRATGTELASAADIAANSLRIFGLSASDMTSVADLLTATANGSAQTVTDLFDALKLVGPTAATAGESITDICAALGILANLGIKGSLAGTALRNSFLQFANPKIQQALEDVNVKTTDATGNLRKMGDIMLDIGVAMANMPSAQRLGFAEDIFGRRGMLAGLTIGADPAKLTAFAARLKDVSKESSRTAREIESGIGGAIDILKSAFTELIIATGDASSAIIKDFAGALSGVFGMVSSVTNAIKGLGDSMSWLGGTVAILGAAGIAAASLHKIITGLAAAFGFLKTAATAAGASVVALTSVCALVTVALAAMIAKALKAQEAVRKLNSEIGGMRRTYDQIKEIQSQYSDDMSAEQRLNLLSREQALLRQNIAEVKALRDADDDRDAHAAYYGDLLSRLQSRLGAVIREERELREVQSSSMAAPDKDRIAELEAKIASEAEDAEARRLRIMEEQTNELKEQYGLAQKHADTLDEAYERLGNEIFVIERWLDDIDKMSKDFEPADIPANLLSESSELQTALDNARNQREKIGQEREPAQKEADKANRRMRELDNNLIAEALAPAAKLLADDAARRQEKQEHEALSGMSEKELRAQRKKEAQNEKALQEHYNDIVSGKAIPNATASEIAKDALETASAIKSSRDRQDEINARLKDVREAREAAKETTPGSTLGSFSAAFFRYASGKSTDATEKIARDTGSLLDVLKEQSRIMKGDSQPAIV